MRRVLMCVLATCLATPAMAAGDDSWIGALPHEETDFAIELSPAGDVLDSRFIQWIAEQPDVAPSASMLAESWGSLAEDLALTPDEARERLLRSRLMLVTGEQGWAVRVGLEPDAAERIRDRLKPVPRQRILNRPVVSFDRGALHAVLLVEPGPERMVSLVIAPPEHSSLLEQVIRAAEAPTEFSVSATRGWSEAAVLAESARATKGATIRVWWAAEGRRLSVLAHLDDDYAWAGAAFEPEPRAEPSSLDAGFELGVLDALDTPDAAMVLLADRALLESDDSIAPLLGPLADLADDGRRKMAAVVRDDVRCEALSGLADVSALDEAMRSMAPTAGPMDSAGRFPGAIRRAAGATDRRPLTWRWSDGWGFAAVGQPAGTPAAWPQIHPGLAESDRVLDLNRPGPIAFALVLRPALAGADPGWLNRFAGVLSEARLIAERQPDTEIQDGLLLLDLRARFEGQE